MTKSATTGGLSVVSDLQKFSERAIGTAVGGNGIIEAMNTPTDYRRSVDSNGRIGSLNAESGTIAAHGTGGGIITGECA